MICLYTIVHRDVGAENVRSIPNYVYTASDCRVGFINKRFVDQFIYLNKIGGQLCHFILGIIPSSTTSTASAATLSCTTPNSNLCPTPSTSATSWTDLSWARCYRSMFLHQRNEIRTAEQTARFLFRSILEFGLIWFVHNCD